MTEYRGTIIIGPDSKILKTHKDTITLTCQSKGKEYVLIQPDKSSINYVEEKKLNHVWQIDEWISAFNTCSQNIRKHTQYLKSKSMKSDK